MFSRTMVTDAIYRNAKTSKMIQYLFVICTNGLMETRKLIPYANYFFHLLPDNFIFLHLNVCEYTLSETIAHLYAYVLGLFRLHSHLFIFLFLLR